MERTLLGQRCGEIDLYEVDTMLFGVMEEGRLNEAFNFLGFKSIAYTSCCHVCLFFVDV